MLHSLDIKNYRALRDFQVDKLGQVNLIVGKNNAGKTTVLDALRLYAANGSKGILRQLAADRDERFYLGEGLEEGELPFEHLFTGRRFPRDGEPLIVGENAGDSALSMRYVLILESEEKTQGPDGETMIRSRRRAVSPSELQADDEDSVTSHGLLLRKGDHSSLLDFSPKRGLIGSQMGLPDLGEGVPFSHIPTRLVEMDELAADWDDIALTEHEDTLKSVLKIVAPELEDLAFVSQEDLAAKSSPPDGMRRRPSRRTAKVKLKGVDKPVPLNSMGDGMRRLLQLVLKMFPARGGMMLIDEFENGLHYSVQKQVWDTVFELAARFDIQVFATTHSWDCIQTFAQSAVDHSSIPGVLFRVGKSARTSDNGRIIATVFDEQRLHRITEADIEVR